MIFVLLRQIWIIHYDVYTYVYERDRGYDICFNDSTQLAYIVLYLEWKLSRNKRREYFQDQRHNPWKQQNIGKQLV